MNNIIKSLVSLIIVLSLVSCKDKKVEEVVADKTDDNVVQIDKSQFEGEKFKTHQPTLQDFNESIQLNGYITVPPKNTASLASLLDGYVRHIDLLVGDKVKKGQYLLSIESPDLIDFQQNYLEVKEQLTYLKNDFERQKTLFEEKISSQKKFFLAESAYKSSLATFTGLENKLRLYGVNLTEVAQGNFTKTIRTKAPISGVISKINSVNGDFVSLAHSILEIINNEYMHLELQAFERDIPAIKKGQEIAFKIPESSEEHFAGVVNLVGASVNQQTKTTSVYGVINAKQKQNLVSGMYTEAQIITHATKILAIQNEAIIKEGTATYVLVLKNKNDSFYEFDRHEVSILDVGELYTTFDEITQLKDQQILTKGAFMFNKD